MEEKQAWEERWDENRQRKNEESFNMHLVGPLFSGSSIACRGGSQETDSF